MPFFILLASVLLALTSIMISTQSGGFAQTCKGYYLEWDYGVSGHPLALFASQCGDGRSGNPPSDLVLDDCIVNVNGAMHWLPNGGFTGSCTDFDLHSITTLSAYCYNDQGKYVASTIDLNSIIGNINGRLVC